MADMRAGLLDLRVPGANRSGIEGLLRNDPSFVPRRGATGAQFLDDPNTPAHERGMVLDPREATMGEVRPVMPLADEFAVRAGGPRPGQTRGRGLTADGDLLPPDPNAPQEPGFWSRVGALNAAAHGADRQPPPQEPGMTTGRGLADDGDLLPPRDEPDVPPEVAAAAGNSPVAQAAARGLVNPRSEEAYGEEGTRDPETRNLSLIDRLFGEDGTPERRQAGIALMRAGAAMMTTNGNLGDAIGNAINAGLTSYDEGMSALREEEMAARQMGMAEEAHQMRMALDRLRMRKLEQGPAPVPTAEQRMLASAEVLEAASHFVTGMDPAIVDMFGGPTQAARALASNSGALRFPANAPRDDTSPFAGLLD